ncbi:MAG TPA: site-2 protease family protein [Candidatus Angelobacter sp.]
MSSTVNPQLASNCRRCSTPLPAGALDCPQCHALVHEEQLERGAARARALEANGSLWDAREQWQAVLPLLPPPSKQAEWIRGHIRELEATLHAPGAPDTRKKWAKWLAPVGPLAVILAKGKTFLLLAYKLKFLLSFAGFIVVYWSLWGWRFGVGFACLILLHEMGHYIDIKSRGLPANMPVFLPGLGAYVKWQAMGVSLETRAAVSLAGPLAGWFGSAVCGLIWYQTRDPIWAALAGTSAWLNVVNLIPVFILDGGQAALALSKVERALLLAASLGLAYLFWQGTFLLVAAGMLWRLFTRDEPPQGSPKMTAYYAAVLTALAFVMWIMHGANFPR